MLQVWVTQGQDSEHATRTRRPVSLACAGNALEPKVIQFSAGADLPQEHDERIFPDSTLRFHAGHILSKLLQLRLRQVVARIVPKDQPSSCGKLRDLIPCYMDPTTSQQS